MCLSVCGIKERGRKVKKEIQKFEEVSFKEKIFTIRGLQVMLDRDLANICGITLPNMNLKTNANKTHGLSEMIRSFKHYVTRGFNELNQNRKFKWQRSFNDHIIRNEKELYYIRQYIRDNPMNW